MLVRKIVLGLTVFLIAMVIIWSGFFKKEKPKELLLDNIEAFPVEEIDNSSCWGNGNITCPATGRKVKYIWSGSN